GRDPVQRGRSYPVAGYPRARVRPPHWWPAQPVPVAGPEQPTGDRGVGACIQRHGDQPDNRKLRHAVDGWALAASDLRPELHGRPNGAQPGGRETREQRDGRYLQRPRQYGPGHGPGRFLRDGSAGPSWADRRVLAQAHTIAAQPIDQVAIDKGEAGRI